MTLLGFVFTGVLYLLHWTLIILLAITTPLWLPVVLIFMLVYSVLTSLKNTVLNQGWRVT